MIQVNGSILGYPYLFRRNFLRSLVPVLFLSHSYLEVERFVY